MVNGERERMEEEAGGKRVHVNFMANAKVKEWERTFEVGVIITSCYHGSQQVTLQLLTNQPRLRPPPSPHLGGQGYVEPEGHIRDGILLVVGVAECVSLSLSPG